MSFSDSFLRAYMTFRPSEAELARRRREKDAGTLVDMVSAGEADERRTKTQNEIYDLDRKFAGMNPTKGKFASADSLIPNEKPTGFISNLKQPEQKPSLVSLVPTAIKAMPQYNDAEMYEAINEARKRGVDPTSAFPFFRNHYANKKEEIDQKALDAEFGTLMNDLKGLDFNNPQDYKTAMLKKINYDKKAARLGNVGVDANLFGGKRQF